MTKGDIIRIEMFLAGMAALAALTYWLTDGLGTALAVYACCFGVPQPFLLIPYFNERRRRRRRNRRL